MAPVKCLQSQALTSCIQHQAELCKEPRSCALRPFSVPATSSSLSSILAAPSQASSLLLLKRVLNGTYLCSRLSKIPSHTKSGSFSRKLQQRSSVRSAHLENGVWNLSGESSHQKRCLRIIAKANDLIADGPQSSGMTLENAFRMLGVGEGSSYEEILRAKKNMMDRSGGDQEQARQVEAAYNVQLMQSLSQRRFGNVVKNAVRYADVRKPNSSSSDGGAEWMQNA